jgi:hypothetical protein
VTGVEPAIRGGLALSSEYAIDLAGAQLAADGEGRAAILSRVLKDPPDSDPLLRRPAGADARLEKCASVTLSGPGLECPGDARRGR